MDSSDLIGLIVELSDALDAAHAELVQLDELEVPLPDKVLKALEERDALSETLKTLPKETRDALVPIYQEAKAKANRIDDGGGVPVNADTVRQVEAAEELLRRRRLTDPDLEDAMRALVPRGDFAGC